MVRGDGILNVFRDEGEVLVRIKGRAVSGLAVVWTPAFQGITGNR